MLTRHIARVVAAPHAKHAVGPATNAAAQANRLCPRSAASRSISSHASLLSALRRSAPLHALSQPTRSPTEDPTGFDAARESAQHEEIMTWDPTMFALAFASTAALAGAIWWGASDAEKDRAVQEAAMMEDLRAEMAAKFGRSKPAECEEKVQDVAPLMRAAVQASHNKYTPSRGAAIVSALALAEDQPIAPWWRRILGFLLDNFMYNGAAFAGQFLIIKARPDWEDRVNATLPSVLWAFIVSVGLETLMLVNFNGRTPGKWATGTRVTRQDGKTLDWVTALKLASTRSLCMPCAALPDTTSLIFSSNCRENGQLVHNWVSDTIVIDQAQINADREADEEED